MHASRQLATGAEKILFALGEFDYLTARQLTRLLYQESSLSFVREKLRALIADALVLAVPGSAVTLPSLYMPTTKGYTLLAYRGVQEARRVRPVDEADKAGNLLFLAHNLFVRDVLIAAHRLSRSVPNVVLTRMATERALRRKIYVSLPEKLLLEPDASVEFQVGEAWKDWFHLEVYRTLPHKDRFQQKIKGYLAYHATGIHEALFATPALGIAVFAATSRMAGTLKSWTEETLRESNQPDGAGLFFFCSLNPATVSPEKLFLSPVWEQALSTTTTPLLVLE